MHTVRCREYNTWHHPLPIQCKHFHRAFEILILFSFLSLCTPYSPHMYENVNFCLQVTFLQNWVSRTKTRGSTVLRWGSPVSFKLCTLNKLMTHPTLPDKLNIQLNTYNWEVVSRLYLSSCSFWSIWLSDLRMSHAVHVPVYLHKMIVYNINRNCGKFGMDCIQIHGAVYIWKRVGIVFENFSQIFSRRESRLNEWKNFHS
jgi:hypothetical protein